MRSRNPELLSQLEQQFRCLVCYAVLGIVEIDPGGVDCHLLPAMGILGEKLTQMEVL